jgi:MerR family transcriptional regulator, copper efflux regulator
MSMNIGAAARASGISAKMIRYYESIGLISPDRLANGYRCYEARDVHLLSFIRTTRALGFSIEQVRSLLALWQDRSRSSADVKALASGHLDVLRERVRATQTIIATLEHLSAACHGDLRPDCPILDGLTGGPRHDGQIALPARAT